MRRPRVTLHRLAVLFLVLFLSQGVTMAGGFYILTRQAEDAKHQAEQDCASRKESREAVRLLVVVATTGSPGHPVDPNNPVVKALTDTLLPGHELDHINC